MIGSPFQCFLFHGSVISLIHARRICTDSNRCTQKAKQMNQRRIVLHTSPLVKMQNIVNPSAHLTNIKLDFHLELIYVSYPECA